MTFRLRRLGALAAIALLTWAPAALAEPTASDTPPAPPPPVGSTTLALADLGSSNTIWFDARRDITSSSISFTVPQGLATATLNATLEVPVNLRFGALTVTQGERTISRMKLPGEDQAAMVIPLPGVQVFDNWASVTLTVSAVPFEDYYCWDPQAPIRLVNSSITFTGNEVVPTTVAEFLPPTLRGLTIAVPAKPSQSESQAAIQLAAAMTTRYGWQNTAITVVALPPGGTPTLPAPAPGSRQIIVRESQDEGALGLSLQPNPGALPALLISGPGEELTNQTRLLTDASLPYALSPKAIAGPLTTEQAPAGDSATLKELNQTGLTAESLRPEVNIKVDQSLFGQTLEAMRVHLIGSYTPLAGNFNGEVTAAVDGEIIDRWPVNAEGTIDRWVDIPNTLVDRITTLKVRLHTTGDPGHCNDYLNIVLRIDDSTVVEAKRASPPVPPGFRSLPQALMPRIQVGIGDEALGDTIRAAQIIVGLQRNSAAPLVTTVTTLEQAIASRDPAVLISAGGWTDDTFALPFSADQGRITIQAFNEADEPVSMTLEPAINFGSLQTLFDGQRSILIATSNGSPAQLDELLRWLSAKSGRWSDLDGRAVISVPGNEPVTVPNRRTDLPTPSDASGTRQPGQGWAWWTAGVIAAVALVGAVWILARTRKPRSRGSEDRQEADGQQKSEPEEGK